MAVVGFMGFKRDGTCILIDTLETIEDEQRRGAVTARVR
jgi:hypothetical protein